MSSLSYSYWFLNHFWHPEAHLLQPVVAVDHLGDEEAGEDQDAANLDRPDELGRVVQNFFRSFWSIWKKRINLGFALVGIKANDLGYHD